MIPCVPKDNVPVRQSRIGPVSRQKDNCETYQLETGFNHCDDRCILSKMEQHSGICIPHDLPHRQMSGQNERRVSDFDHSYAYMARPTLVCDTITDGSQISHIVASNEQLTHKTGKRVSSDGSSNDTSRLENSRENARNSALWSEAQNLLKRKIAEGSKRLAKAPGKLEKLTLLL